MRVAIFGALLVVCMSATAQTPVQFSENAKRAAAVLQQTSVAIQESPPGKFYRAEHRLDGTSWDVKKTDSMLNPVQAMVKASIVSSGTDSYATKEEAGRAGIFTTSATKLELTYVPSASGWVYLEGRLYADVLRTWIPIEYGKCAEKKALICTVVDSFVVSK